MAIMGSNRRGGMDAPSEPQTSGWPALYKNVRDADITKVDDCRDDIDTLLVFAGLYSAVLTAFVVESYTHLQQDPQDVIIGLLQQIATQRFISGPGFINSTITSPEPLPFKPPLWAIRVNTLWFTSLLLSLSSASFGILVKQWLREYLAIDYSAPRERLRARQYRNPALAQWKVFEIAAFLPLLLQLSLGLFFIGLCFFTAAVHRSIGRATTPLVCAWAFLFFITTLAPLFSPRCPFKTTFLKGVLKMGRRGRRAMNQKASLGWVTFVHHLPRSMRPSNLGRLNWPGRSLLSVIIILSSALLPIWFLLCMFHPRTFGDPSDSNTQEGGSFEEDEVVKTEAEDVEILLSIDSLMSDDGLLPIMADALQQQAEGNASKAIEFVSRIIGRRTGVEYDGASFPHILDLRTLSMYTWAATTDAITDALLQGTHRANEIADCGWVFEAVIILFSHSRYGLSDRAVGAIQEALPCGSRAADHRCIGLAVQQHVQDDNRVLPALELAQRTLVSRMPDMVNCLRCFMDVYKTCLCQEPDHSHPSLRHLLDVHTSHDAFIASSEEFLQDLIGVLASFLLWTVSSRKLRPEINGFHEALHIVLQYGEKFGRRDDAVELCRQMLLTESGTHAILIQFAALHPQCRVSDSSQGILWESLRGATAYDRVLMEAQLATALNRLHDGGDEDVPLDYVRFCAVRSLVTDRAALAKAIENYHQTQGWSKELRRREYWHNGAKSSTLAPEELLAEDEALACTLIKEWWVVTTELIDALWLFVPNERREEILRSIPAWRKYTPRAHPVVGTGLRD